MATPMTDAATAAEIWAAALALTTTGAFDAAEERLTEALTLGPRHLLAALGGLATLYGLRGRFDETQTYYDHALDVGRQLGGLRWAAAGMAEVAAAAPRLSHAWARNAAALLAVDPPQPNEDPFPWLLARALGEMSETGVDVDALRAATALRPQALGLRRLMMQNLINQQRYDDLLALEISSPLATPTDEDVALLGAALSRAQCEDETVLRALLMRWAVARPGSVAPPLLPPSTAPSPRDPTGRRLRVGICQAWFHHAAYYNGLIPTLRGAAAAGLDLFAYHVGVSQRAAAPALAPFLAGWRDLEGIEPDAAAAMIAADQLDILLDMEGLSTAAPLELYRRRPAPVIASGYNTFCTLGPGLFDWVIGDWATLPPGAEADYSEKLARLPAPYSFAAYSMQAWAPLPAPVYDAPPTFGGFCQVWKLSDGCLRAWTQILRACPDARLLLRTGALKDPAAAAALRARFAAAGAPAERIDCDGETLPYEDHLRRYDRIDVLLDSFPFQGPSTVFEALWMGVPVIARRGRRWVARMGAAKLSAAGLASWIADDEDAYIRLAAAALAGAPTRRDPAIRLALREQVAASALCDADGFGRAFAALLRQIVEDERR